MLEEWQITNKFWDQVFPVRAQTFQRTQEIMNKFGYDNELVAKSVQVYIRMDKILCSETRNAFRLPP